MAKLIAFEGPDRVGKATQSKLMLETLTSLGYRAVRVEVPVQNFLHKYIYKMLKNGVAKNHPYFFQFIQVMNRVVFQLFALPKLERENDYVIFDRWSPSTWVYGLATGVNRTYVEAMLYPIRKPDYTIVLNGRAQVQEMRDDYEKDNSLQSRVRDLYVDYADLYSEKTALVWANQTRESAHEEILGILLQRKLVTTPDTLRRNS